MEALEKVNKYLNNHLSFYYAIVLSGIQWTTSPQ